MQSLHGICIHSHFYQPPREDPWLDSVMKDPTAAPYHDWNTCVYEQCYKPNRAARLTDAKGRIVYITNNYKHMNFNVGPTLHSWLAKRDPILAQSIVDADRSAIELFGEGGAIAQAYNHMILPLADERDKRTQVVWGLKDFGYRFGRNAEGMWLPETAVDTASLEALAAEGIKFTILAPHQCAAVLPPRGVWHDTPGGGGLDTMRPYFMRLPSGARINLIFYYGSIAHDIAFGGLLDNGDFFVESLMRALPRDGEARLLTIATDGETYGHHHRYGEMALARATQRLCDSPDVMLTNVSTFLNLYPPTWECRIAENTSWSCAHGVERWRSSCGCHTGGEPGWHQKWRGPLREALDGIRDRIDEIYEERMRPFCDSPWGLRDEAIALYLMNFGEKETIESVRERKRAFLKNYCGDLSDADLRTVLSLIETQRMRMFMYTSCGWFFNDISGIETKQILAYALRAMQYVKDIADVDLEEAFLGDLKKAIGNTSDLPTGYDVMDRCVLPMKRTVIDVAASVALLAKENSYYTFRVKSDARSYPSGDIDLRVGSLSVADVITTEGWSGAFSVISTGGLDDVCRLSEREAISQKAIRSNFYEGDILSISKFLESSFERGPWHFRDVAQNDKDQVVLERSAFTERGHLEHAEDLLQGNQRLLVQLGLMGVAAPPFLCAAANLVYEHKMGALRDSSPDVLDLLMPGSKLEILLEEAHGMGIYPEVSVLAPGIADALHDSLERARRKNDKKEFERILYLWNRAIELDIKIDRWRLQNRMWAILGENSSAPPEAALALADALGFATPEH